MKKGLLCVAALAAVLCLAACSSIPGLAGGASGAEAADGVYYIGDTVSTVFLDFTVDSVDVEDSYQGYTPAGGGRLVVASLTIQNTERYSMPMGQMDFPLVWGTGDSDWDYPLAQFCDKQFADEYEIPINGSAQGVLVYEVPRDVEDCALVFEEYFEDDTVGEQYAVFFTLD